MPRPPPVSPDALPIYRGRLGAVFVIFNFQDFPAFLKLLFISHYSYSSSFFKNTFNIREIFPFGSLYVFKSQFRPEALSLFNVSPLQDWFASAFYNDPGMMIL